MSRQSSASRAKAARALSTICVALAVMALPAAGANAAVDSHHGASAALGFNEPSGIEVVNGDAWVLNEGTSTLTEFAVDTGAWVRTVSVPALSYDQWDVMTIDGVDLWIACGAVNKLVEVSTATGRIVRTVTSTSRAFDASMVAFDGTDLWVAGGADLVEVNPANGAILRYVANAADGFDKVWSLAATGGRLWVTSYTLAPFEQSYGTLAEVNEATGAVVRLIHGERFALEAPIGMASNGTDLWVANFYGSSVTEIDVGSGALLKVVASAAPWSLGYGHGHVWVADDEFGGPLCELNASNDRTVATLRGSADGINWPYAMALDGTHVWLANFNANSVTEVNESNDSFVGVIEGPELGLHRLAG